MILIGIVSRRNSYKPLFKEFVMKYYFRSWRKNFLSTWLIAPLFCILVPLSMCVAASDEITPAIGLNCKALLFSFSGLATLGADAFDGGFVGKYYLTDVLALRGVLQFATASQNVPASPGPGQAGTDGSISGTKFGLGAAVEYHLLKTRVSPYIGGGIGFSTTSTESKSSGSATPPIVYTQTVVKNSTGTVAIGGTSYVAGFKFGIDGLAGVEFFITKEVSIAAEYQLGYSLISPYDQQTITGNVTTTVKTGSTNSVGISSAGVLTLAFYF
jgi:opacity protein-like surface antigen